MAIDAHDTSLRAHRGTADTFRRLAAREGKPLTRYLDDVAAREERRAFWEDYRQAVERLRADPVAWAAYQDEQRELDATLMDGLDANEGSMWRDVWEAQQRGEPLAISWESEATETGEVDGAR